MSSNQSSAVDVARWMVEELHGSGGCLYQDSAVGDIASKFGDQFTYTNENGNEAISKDVLSEFRNLTGDTVVWDRGEKCWRLREKHDAPGRRQD